MNPKMSSKVNKRKLCTEWCISKIRFLTGNLVWQSLIGFMGGVLLTYLFFFFFYIGVNISIRATTYICGLAGIVLCLGLAFSSKIRCYVLLLLPVLFSKEGREVLLAYALFLAFTGPGSNTMHNMGILSDSMTCGQEMVKRTLKQIIETVKTPCRSTKESLERVARVLKETVDSVNSYEMKIKRLIFCILSVIQKATAWLGSIVNICRRNIGTPFQRCMKTFDDAIVDCKAKLGVLDFLCHVVHITKSLCYRVKNMDFICIFTEFVSEKIIRAIKKRLTKFNLRLRSLFYVSVEFNESCEIETKAPNTTKEVAKTIFKKISSKIEGFQSVFNFFGFTFSLLFLFLIFKVYYYKYKFLSSDQYDNVYISKYIVDLDVKRAQMDRETVLPLEPRERKIYAKPTVVRLLKIEKSRISQSLFFLSLTSFKIITFLVVDYSLFWVLLTIYEAGRDAEVEVEGYGVRVEGKGILANLYRKLGKALQVPENPNMHLTPLHCLPDPIRPDTGRYKQIGFLVVLCWILTLTAAYGLRLRNVVMSHYYPDRAKERAIWLYNHILQSRSSFVRDARRQLRKKFGEQLQTVEPVPWRHRLFANFPVLCTMFGGKKDEVCLICEASGTENEPIKRCRTSECKGRYCPPCFATLKNVCTICQHPVEYGDVSDISEEIDSSDEDSDERKSEKQQTSEKEEFLTFKEMEVRERFRDVESNILIDYAKLGDLVDDSETKILHEKTPKSIKKAKLKKSLKTKIKMSMYKEIRLKLQNLVARVKKRKSNEALRRKAVLKVEFAEKVNNIKKLKERKRSEHKSLLANKHASGVSSRFDSYILEGEQLDYKKLKEKVREKIKLLKENKGLESRSVEHNNSSKTGKKSDNKSPFEDSDGSFNKNYLTYYFVESEKDCTYYTQPWRDGKSSSTDSFLEDEKPENYLM